MGKYNYHQPDCSQKLAAFQFNCNYNKNCSIKAALIFRSLTY